MWAEPLRFLRMATWLKPKHGPISFHRAMPSQGDKITVDAEKLQLTVDISDAELKSRKDAWKQPPLPVIWTAKKRSCI